MEHALRRANCSSIHPTPLLSTGATGKAGVCQRVGWISAAGMVDVSCVCASNVAMVYQARTAQASVLGSSLEDEADSAESEEGSNSSTAATPVMRPSAVEEKAAEPPSMKPEAKSEAAPKQPTPDQQVAGGCSRYPVNVSMCVYVCVDRFLHSSSLPFLVGRRHPISLTRNTQRRTRARLQLRRPSRNP